MLYVYWVCDGLDGPSNIKGMWMENFVLPFMPVWYTYIGIYVMYVHNPGVHGTF